MSRARKQDRFLSSLAVSYREPTSSEPSLGSCVDISPSGMFIETARPAARGVLVRFECVSTEPQGVVRGTARVMWLRPHNDAQGRAGMGVRFVRLEPGSTRVIEDLIAQAGPNPEARMPSDGPEARKHSDEPAVVMQAERTIGPTNRSSSVPPKGLRAPTLRGMYPADVRSDAPRSHSSNPPARNDAPSYRGPASNAPLPDARNGAGSNALRERVAASRASNPPSAPDSRPPTTSAESRATAPDGSRATTPDGSSPLPVTGADTPAAKPNFAATVHHINPPPTKLSTPSGSPPRRGSDHALGVPSPPPPPWKSRQSERPPEPGGVEVVRTVSVTTEARPDPDARQDHRPAHETRQQGRGDARAAATHIGDAFTQQAHQAAAAAASAANANANASTSHAAHVHTELPGAEEAHRPEWEPSVEPARPAMRPDRVPPELSTPYVLGAGALAEEEEGKPSKSYLGWIVVGSGAVVAVLLGVLFGKGPAGIPGGVASVSPATATPAPETVFVAPKVVDEATVAPTAQEPTQVVINVRVEPMGATVIVLDQRITSPGTLLLPIATVVWPLRVRAELQGYGATELQLPRSVFNDGARGLTYDLLLSLQAIEGAAAGTTGSTTAPTASTSSSSSRERRSSRPKPAQPSAATATAATPVPAPTPAPQPTTATEPIMSPSPPPSPDTAPEPAKSALDRALECLGRGDNACVVKELEGSSGARELDLLIETYRASGDSASAERSMQRYLDLHPDGRRAPQYRRALGIAEPAAP